MGIQIEEDRLRKLTEEMKRMEEEHPKVKSKPPTIKPPKPISEKALIQKESHVLKNNKAATVMTVDSNSFMPKKNKKSEVQVLKIGSPSQIRKAVLCEVKVEQRVIIRFQKYQPLYLSLRILHQNQSHLRTMQ